MPSALVLGDGEDKEVYNAYSMPSRHSQYGRKQKMNSCNNKKKIEIRLCDRSGRKQRSLRTQILEESYRKKEGKGELELELGDGLNQKGGIIKNARLYPGRSVLNAEPQPTSCVALVKSLHLSEPQLPPRWNWLR